MCKIAIQNIFLQSGQILTNCMDVPMDRASRDNKIPLKIRLTVPDMNVNTEPIKITILPRNVLLISHQMIPLHLLRRLHVDEHTNKTKQANK